MKRETRIRFARPDDREALLSLLAEADEVDGGTRAVEAREWPIGEALRRVAPGVVLAVVDQITVGYTLFHRIDSALAQPGGLFMDDIFVREAWRRRGVGRALVDEVMRIAALEERVRVDFTTRASNADALAFYEQLGAELYSETPYLRIRVTPTGR